MITKTLGYAPPLQKPRRLVVFKDMATWPAMRAAKKLYLIDAERRENPEQAAANDAAAAADAASSAAAVDTAGVRSLSAMCVLRYSCGRVFASSGGGSGGGAVAGGKHTRSSDVRLDHNVVSSVRQDGFRRLCLVKV